MGNLSSTGRTLLNISERPSGRHLADDSIHTFQEALLNRVSEGLCVCHDIAEHPYVRFTIWNDRMTEITGYELEEINRLGWYQQLYPNQEIRERAIARMTEMRKGYDLNAEEWIITAADGSQKIVEITTSVLHVDKNQQTHVFAMIRDVTEIQAEAERKAKLQRQMARAEKMESVGLLAGGVAHDLNNMLGPVIGYADLLLAELKDDESKRTKVQRIKKAAADAANIVMDLLTLARRGKCELVPADISTLVRECMTAPWFQHLCEMNPEIQVESKVDGVSVNVLASAQHVKKAIMNLVCNAVDAMPVGGKLTIETALASGSTIPHIRGKARDQKYVGITVRDTGHGIEPENLSKIFEPYFSKKALSSSHGSGLGLAVVYGVLKDHGGVYDVHSRVGEGTQFTLYFPVCSGVIDETADGCVDLHGCGTILVVDDDPDQRELAQDLLESLGYDVLTAENGHRAVEMLANVSVDLVMLDMIMEPGYDGLDTFVAIKRIRPDQRAIIVTGYSETERVRKACELGVAECVQKPYSLDLLAGVLKNVLT